MSTEQNKAIVLEFYKAFDHRKIDQALALLAPNFIAHMAGVDQPLNKDEFKKFGFVFYSAFPDGKHTFEQILTDGNKVVTYGIFTGTHRSELQGLPATKKQVNFSLMHIDQVEDGKIIEHWGQGDQLELLRQLGVMTIPGPTLYPKILQNILSKLFQPKKNF